MGRGGVLLQYVNLVKPRQLCASCLAPKVVAGFTDISKPIRCPPIWAYLANLKSKARAAFLDSKEHEQVDV